MLALGAGLAGCSGATVEKDQTPTSVAPLTRGAQSAEGSESTASKASKAKPTASQVAKDGPGTSVSQLPEPTDYLSEREKEYLKKLEEGGIDIEGIENQLVGVASVACKQVSPNLAPATVDAVAGQVIEQGRTTKSFEEVRKLIETSARSAYC